MCLYFSVGDALYNTSRNVRPGDVLYFLALNKEYGSNQISAKHPIWKPSVNS